MTSFLLSHNYHELLSAFMAKGYTVVAPVNEKGVTLFRAISNPGSALLPAEYISTTRSAKEFFFPLTEPVAQFTVTGKEVTVAAVPVAETKLLIAGVRPCDAAAFTSMGLIFNYVYNDTFFTARRGNAVVLSIACSAADDACFCTSFGIAPDSPEGADLFLLQSESGNWVLQAHTTAGTSAIAELEGSGLTAAEAFTPAPEYARTTASVRQPLNLNEVARFLAEHFEDGPWQEFERCLGCASCAYLCPTCHCFDIVDREQYNRSLRVKNWDACQFPVFTKHAGGHNPRNAQAKRYRQRLMHKFKYFNDRFGTHLCTGCGRCVRNCPVNIDIYEAAANCTVQQV